MAFSQSIFDKKDEFYKRFAKEFFDKNFWEKISNNEGAIFDSVLCGF